MPNKSIFPDVTGYLLRDARFIIENAGITINKIAETSPPKAIKNQIEDSFRVIKIIRHDNDKSCNLIVCRPL